MARLFIEKDDVKITSGEAFLLNLEFRDGKKIENAEARRLFPISAAECYITLLDEAGSEIAVVKDLNTLEYESQKVLRKSLEEYYMIPKILKVTGRAEKHGDLRWSVITDRGEREIKIRNRHTDIKSLTETNILIKDSNDNRYEISDLEALDKASFNLISIDL